MRLALFLILAAALAPCVRAQPSAEALVGAWRASWTAAARGVDRVEMDEAIGRRLEGPHGTVEMEALARLVFDRSEARGRADRQVRSATLDGQPVEASRLAELDGRLARAFGGHSAATTDTPSLVPRSLLVGEPEALAADRIDGRAAWRVSLRIPPRPDRAPSDGRRRRSEAPRPDRAEAWFTRSSSDPRLLRVRVAGGRAGASRFVRTVDYDRTDGLDLPAAMRATVEMRQRRRLRGYATTLEVTARYGRPAVVRR